MTTPITADVLHVNLSAKTMTLRIPDLIEPSSINVDDQFTLYADIAKPARTSDMQSLVDACEAHARKPRSTVLSTYINRDMGWTAINDENHGTLIADGDTALVCIIPSVWALHAATDIERTRENTIRNAKYAINIQLIQHAQRMYRLLESIEYNHGRGDETSLSMNMNYAKNLLHEIVKGS